MKQHSRSIRSGMALCSGASRREGYRPQGAHRQQGDEGWAGSAGGDGAKLDAALIEAYREAEPGQVARLDELRGKLADTGYVEGAVTTIASFLSAHMDKGKRDDRRT